MGELSQEASRLIKGCFNQICSKNQLTILNTFEDFLKSIIYKESVEFLRFFIEQPPSFVCGPKDAMVRIVREGFKDAKWDVVAVGRVLKASSRFCDVRNDDLRNDDKKSFYHKLFSNVTNDLPFV